MPTIILGRDQTLTIDGTTAEGTREVDVDVAAKDCKVTSWEHDWESTLTLTREATLKVLIYGQEVYDSFSSKFNAFPPQPVTIAISNVGSGKFVQQSVRITQPIDGVMAWEVTFKSWNYE